jgi:hypothetical protein
VNDSTRGGANFRATEQGFAYRRGFVLGLTLAETALLLVFVILLLLAIGFERRDRRITELALPLAKVREMLPANSQGEADVVRELARLVELRQAAAAAGIPWDDTFIELVKAVSLSSSGQDMVTAAQALAEEREKLRRIEALLSEKGKGENIQELAQTNVEQATTIENQRGQLRQLLERLNREGKGGVLPSCWTSPEGKIEFILDTALDARGIRVRDTAPVYRQAERERLPWPRFPADGLVSPAQFLVATEALFDWSAENDCRFYVVVYDATGDDQKTLYKTLLESVEGHFYKRLSRDAPGF